MYASDRIISNLDAFIDRLLGRVFKKKYPFQPLILQEMLVRALNISVRSFDGGLFLPNRVSILMNPDDHQEFVMMGSFCRAQIAESAEKYLREEFPEAIAGSGKLTISYGASAELPKGAFRITADCVGEEQDKACDGGGQW